MAATAQKRVTVRDERPVPLLFRVIATCTFVFMLTPVVIVVLASVNRGDYLTFPPQGLSFRWIAAFLSSPYFMKAYGLSLGLALLTALVATVLGTMAALVLVRGRFPGRDFMQAFFLSPLMLPGIVIGLALFSYYSSLGIGLARSLTGLLIGHVVVSTPYVIRTVSAVLIHFDQSLEEAARSLGAGPVKTFFKVTLPVLNPGMMAGALFAMIISFGQFDVSLFLQAPNLTPLPIALYTSLRYKFEPTAAAASTFAIVLVVCATLLTNRFTKLDKVAGLE